MLDKTFERDPALKPLSRDHGVLLVLVQRLRKAAEATEQDRVSLVTEIRSRLASVVEQYLIDEDTTLSLMTFNKLVRDEVTVQHDKIKQAIAQFSMRPISELKSDDFTSLSNLIEDHVRWDERVVLPYLQRELSADERTEVAEHTAQVESHRSRPTQELHRSINLDKEAGVAQTCSCSDAV